MLFKEENKYLEIANQIIDEGYIDTSRTGIAIRKIHVAHMSFDLSNGKIPIPSTRKIPFKSPIREMEWFISGSTNIAGLKKYGLNIWDSWVKPGTHVYDDSFDRGIKELASKGLIKPRTDLTSALVDKYGPGYVNQLLSDVTGVDVTKRKLIDGSIGEGAYGAQWRKWDDVRLIPYEDEDQYKFLLSIGYNDMEFEIDPGSITQGDAKLRVMQKKYDQLQAAIDLINNSPDSRRIIVSAWNPGKLDTQQLPPCHSFFQFLPFEKNGEKYLDLSLTCRSQDFLVGTVFNVAQYAALCHMVAHLTGRKANRLFWQGNNTHIYEDQVEIYLEVHKERSPLLNPDLKLTINPDKEFKTIDDFVADDIVITGYDNYHDVINYPIAV